MALASSHIRFAIDIQNKMGVTNVCDYVLGSIYPDSRYVTKIDRHLTHPLKEYQTDPTFKKDDFRKGWYTHLLCDDIQYALITELFPEVGESDSGEQDSKWVKRTSVKILQDIEDAKSFDIQKYLGCLSEARNPNREDIEKVKFFNESKGIGFIIDDESSKEYFVHVSGLIDEIREDDDVSFDLKEGRKGLNAVNVKVVNA